MQALRGDRLLLPLPLPELRLAREQLVSYESDQRDRSYVSDQRDRSIEGTKASGRRGAMNIAITEASSALTAQRAAAAKQPSTTAI